MKWIAATNNLNKLREIKQILNPYGIEIISLKEIGLNIHVVEDGNSFAENALKKAYEVYGHTNIPTLADDSGLAVDALDGRPGIFSARYAGENATDEDNNKKLLSELRDVPKEKRTARYVCTMVLMKDENSICYGSGECNGYILSGPKGSNGFGYDPFFYVPKSRSTFAEMTEGKKNEISHRTAALKNLLSNTKMNS